MDSSRRLSIAIVVVLLIVLTWLVLDSLALSNPVRDVFSYVVTPLQYAVSRAAQPVVKFVGDLGEISQLRTENERLEQENAELRRQIVLLQEAEIQNEILRRELNFKEAVPNYELLAAEVIGHDSSNLLQYLILDRGADDGIERNMPVISGEGLVGRISEVSSNSAKVMLITSPSSSVGALVQRSRATGIVQGNLQNSLEMRYIQLDADVAPGDLVLTSGLGGNFPKRLVIGQIVKVEHQEVDMFQQATLVPAVNLKDLEVVMIMVSFSSGDMVE